MSLGDARGDGRAAASTTRSAAASRATRSTPPGPCPHFEKMLYDNALLARAYLHGWQVSGEERFRRVCCETLDWALREMRGPEGGFCSALDADSEGVEGKFYVWTPSRAARGRSATELGRPTRSRTSARPSAATSRARNVLEGARARARRRCRRSSARLLEARSTRVRPGLDDKRLTSWNALMIVGAGRGRRGARARRLRRGGGRLRGRSC